MGYRLNCQDEPVLIAVSKPLLTEFGINHRLESCGFAVIGSLTRDMIGGFLSLANQNMMLPLK